MVYSIMFLLVILFVGASLIGGKVEKRLDRFFGKHRKLDIVYKLIHWSLATFILIIGLPIILFMGFFMGFDPLTLYGFKTEDLSWKAILFFLLFVGLILLILFFL